MARLLFSPLAEGDLDDIVSYIRNDDPFAARRWFDDIVRKCRLLCANPQIGRARNFLRPGLLAAPMANYLIIYRPVPGGIEIIRVVDGRRDLPRILADPDN